LLRLRLVLVFCVIVFCTLAVPVQAGEYALLASGLRLHADRHERSGAVIRLYNGAGVTELPASSVIAFEQEDYVAPPSPQAPEARPLANTAMPHDPKTLVRAAAVRNGLPPAFVESVARVESGLDPHAVSPKGAVGVMQLMPDTARTLGADASDPAQNIDAGTHLLRELLIKYGGDVVKALAAYNAGEGAVARYQGVPPYPETERYVNKVVREYQRAHSAGSAP
jgi:soluble lytic murein transglycosylase-like protein